MAEAMETLAVTKLTRTEFAVVRAYAQGMRPVDIANRYLLDADDDDDLTEHQAVQRILALRDRLVQFALQHDRPDIAEMFEALRGRSDAGMSRRVEALSSIEQLGQGRPLPTHQVSLWFGPSLARRLVAAELHTIADLVGLANRRGSSWWRHVPRIGRHSAETIVRWLGNQQAMFDVKLQAFVRAPSEIVSRGSLLAARLGDDMPHPVPLELMLDPVGPDPIKAALAEDLRSVREWVAARQETPNTWKSYRREAERILLWSARQNRSPRSLTTEDLETYRSFLLNPQPSAFWCGPASQRDKAHWRPFEGPLRTSSCEAALRVVRILLRGLRAEVPWKRTHALPQSAVRGIDDSAPAVAAADTAPAEAGPDLGGSIVQFLDWLGGAGSSPGQRAAHAAALLIARHGMRIVELPAFRLGDLVPSNGPPRMTCHAKSEARRGEIELASDVWTALLAHWGDRGLVWLDQASGWTPDAALLAPIRFPSTGRGRAKQAQRAAGYSASGLDQLLRASWKRFAAAHDNVPSTFTPRQLRLV